MEFDKWKAFEEAWNDANSFCYPYPVDRSSFKTGFFMGLNAWNEHQEILRLQEIYKKMSGSSQKKLSKKTKKKRKS